jgi:hypothetical protein
MNKLNKSNTEELFRQRLINILNVINVSSDEELISLIKNLYRMKIGSDKNKIIRDTLTSYSLKDNETFARLQKPALEQIAYENRGSPSLGGRRKHTARKTRRVLRKRKTLRK